MFRYPGRPAHHQLCAFILSCMVSPMYDSSWSHDKGSTTPVSRKSSLEIPNVRW